MVIGIKTVLYNTYWVFWLYPSSTVLWILVYTAVYYTWC